MASGSGPSSSAEFKVSEQKVEEAVRLLWSVTGAAVTSDASEAGLSRAADANCEQGEGDDDP